LAGHGFSQYEGGMITTRMRAVAADPDFIQHCPDLDFYTGAWHDLADAALQLYWQSPSFTALHIVTGVSAARQIASRLPVQLQHQLFVNLWPALCAAYVVVGAPALSNEWLPVQFARPDLTWRECMDRAIQCNDEHIIKMTYTCYLENALCNSPIYLMVVQRLVSNVA
ncbi:MAG: questin oxidase family protein, partial [Burkholderiaceae bacterium]|nr:questin oxidase family protein [Burkholderiaceae bacterium]